MRKKIEINVDENMEGVETPTRTTDTEASVTEAARSEPPVAAKPDEAAPTGKTIDDGGSAYIVALQAELEEAHAKLEDAEKRVAYAHAEFQNFRRRKEEESKDLAKFAKSELIKSLLPVVDNFERALQAAEQTRNFDSLIGGISGTLKQIHNVLSREGVTPIEALGKEFDPKFHEAIGHTEEGGLPANTVAEEVQRGYLHHDRVLRPTLVKVSQG